MSVAIAQPDRFDALLIAMCERELTDAERAELFAHLAAHPEDRDRYVDYQLLNCTLGWERARAHPDESAGATDADRPRRTAPVAALRFPVVYAVAAAVLLTAAAVAVYFAIAGSGSSTVAPMGPQIATLIESSGSLTVNDDLGVDGRDYAAGEYVTGSGAATFQLTSGAGVRMFSDTRMVISNPMRASLAYGTASFNCPSRAKGFTVTVADGTRVVDLGTGFTIRYQPGSASRIDVTEGWVRIERPDLPGGLELMAGETVLVDAEPEDTGRARIRRIVADDPEVIDRSGFSMIDWTDSDPGFADRLFLRNRPDPKLERPDPYHATRVTEAGVLQVTSEVSDQYGSAWYRDRVRLVDGFVARFTFSFERESEGRGADGMSFVIQDHEEGTRLVVGEQGNQHEFGPTVPRALAVEFDSYMNSGDPSGSHVAVRVGDQMLGVADLTQMDPPIESLTHSGRHDVVVRYAHGRMSVEMDGRTIIETTPVDLKEIGAADEDGRSWVGFSARTGGTNQEHNIYRWSLKTARP